MTFEAAEVAIRAQARLDAADGDETLAAFVAEYDHLVELIRRAMEHGVAGHDHHNVMIAHDTGRAMRAVLARSEKRDTKETGNG